MNKIFTLLLIILISTTSFAQTHPGGFHEHKRINMASVLASKPKLAQGFSSVSEARSIINDIMDVVDQQQNFEVVSTTQVDNAAAMFYMGKRYILYNPAFINRLDNAANDKWAAISVLAHEIGHHLLGHTLDGRGSQHPKELASDEFSGLVMRRLGASLQQAQLAMSLISSPQASASHPGKNDRLLAIAKGWNGTSTRQTNDRDVAIDYPSERTNDYPNTERRSTPSNNPGNGRRYPSDYPSQGRTQQPSRGTIGYPRQRNVQQQSIAYRVRFNSSNGQAYFITTANNVIMLRGNSYQTVAKIAGTNRANYPYVIYDDQVQLFVDRRGYIFSENGRNVGQITRA